MKETTSAKKVVKNSVIYALGGLLTKCFSFFLLPLYTSYLTTEDYGIQSVVNSFIATASLIVSFSLYSAVIRFYVDLEDKPKKLKRFYGSIISFVFLSSILFGIVLYFLRDSVTKYVFQGIDFYPIVLVSLCALVFTCQQTIYDNILKSQQKAAKSSILSIAYFLISVTLNIVFVVYLKLGALGTVLSTFISTFVYTVYFILDMLISKQITFCLDFALLKDALKYSLPIMPHSLSTRIAVLLSKILIGDKASVSHLGIYSIASQFGDISDTLQCYVDSAYQPWIYEKLKNKEDGYKKSIRDIVKALIAVLGLFFIGIALFSQDYIMLFIDRSYFDAWKYIPMIVGIYAIKTMYYFYVEVLFYYKKASRYLFIATISSSLLNILLSYVFIPKWGIIGSIAADAIAMLLRVSIIYAISIHFDDVGLKLRDFIINFFVIALFIIAGLLPSFIFHINKFNIWNFLYKGVITLLYIGVVFLTNKNQIMQFIAYMKNKKKKGKEV